MRLCYFECWVAFLLSPIFSFKLTNCLSITGYLGDILDDLGHSLTDGLMSIVFLLKLNPSEYWSRSTEHPQKLVSAIRRMRNLTTASWIHSRTKVDLWTALKNSHHYLQTYFHFDSTTITWREESLISVTLRLNGKIPYLLPFNCGARECISNILNLISASKSFKMRVIKSFWLWKR